MNVVQAANRCFLTYTSTNTTRLILHSAFNLLRCRNIVTANSLHVLRSWDLVYRDCCGLAYRFILRFKVQCVVQVYLTNLSFEIA